MPCWTASSKPFSEIALISVTVATLISSFESPLFSDARSLLLLPFFSPTCRGGLNISRRLLRLGVDIAYSPVPIGQDRRRADAHIVGYYAPAAETRVEEGLGHRGGVLRDLIQDPANGLPRNPLSRHLGNRDRAAIAVDRRCTQRPAVVGIHIAAQANRSTEELSPRNGRAAAHPLVQPQGRELRVEGGAKQR